MGPAPVAEWAAARSVKAQRLAEAHGQPRQARHVETSTGERLVGARDGRGHHGDPGAQGDHGHAGLPGHETALARKGPLGEDADDAAFLEHSKRALDGAGIRPLESDGNRADAPMEARAEWAHG